MYEGFRRGSVSTNLNEVHLVEVVISARSLNVEDGDDVLMVEVAEKLHLSECPKAEHGMVKWSDLLDGHLLTGGLVDSRAISVGGAEVSIGC